MGNVKLNEKPTAEDFAYAYAEDSTGATVRVPKEKIHTLETDDTLTQSGIPADAKAVGNKFGKLSEEKVDQTQLTNAVNYALAQAKESGEFDGRNGSDYVLTEADKEEIAENAKEKVLAEVPEEVLVLTELELEALTREEIAVMYEEGTRLIAVVKGYTNLVPLSINTLGAIYNGCGYLNNYRLNSSGAIVSSNNVAVSGFMLYTHGSKIHVVGSTSESALSAGGQYIAVYDSGFNVIAVAYPSSLVNSGIATWSVKNDGRYELVVDTSKLSAWANATYFRVSCTWCVGENMEVAVNEEITGGE